jgi:hypothetical protein
MGGSRFSHACRFFADCIGVDDPAFSYRPTIQDEGDELVVDAAINAHADIVAFNVRDFQSVLRFGIRLFRPGELLDILEKRGTT